MLRDSQNRGKMLLALNKAFLYLNCQPRIFRKVPQASLSVCTKNYAPVYKHGWMQNHKLQGQTPLCPAIPALHVLHIQPHPAGVVRWRWGQRRLHQEFQSHREGGEREEEEEEATAATGVRKGGRTPHLPWLSHPAGQVGGEEQEECGAQSQGPGSVGGVFVEKLENEIPW